MTRIRTTFRFIVLGIAAHSAACAYWFVPQSQSRGHIFDEASRGGPQGGINDGQLRLEIVIDREFPPGTPVPELIDHIETAGGTCSPAIFSETDPSVGSTACTYESISYFPFAFMALGEPSFHEGHNRWIVGIAHTDGIIDGYRIRGTTITNYLNREEYMERLALQRQQEAQPHLKQED